MERLIDSSGNALPDDDEAADGTGIVLPEVPPLPTPTVTYMMGEGVHLYNAAHLNAGQQQAIAQLQPERFRWYHVPVYLALVVAGLVVESLCRLRVWWDWKRMQRRGR